MDYSGLQIQDMINDWWLRQVKNMLKDAVTYFPTE